MRRRGLLVSRILGVVAALFYLASFALPDHQIRWSGPVGRPGSPGSVDEYYFLPEMVSTFTHSWGEELDWAGWLAHCLALIGFTALVTGRRRLAVGAAVFGVVAGLARYCTVWTMGFREGYYVWLASLALLGASGAFGIYDRRATATAVDPASQSGQADSA